MYTNPTRAIKGLRKESNLQECELNNRRNCLALKPMDLFSSSPIPSQGSKKCGAGLEIWALTHHQSSEFFHPECLSPAKEKRQRVPRTAPKLHDEPRFLTALCQGKGNGLVLGTGKAVEGGSVYSNFDSSSGTASNRSATKP